MVGNKCFAPGCKSGYPKDRQQRKNAGLKSISLFKCPNVDNLYRWHLAARRADRSFTQSDKLCELHFKEENILRYYEIKMPNYIHKIERERPTLRKDAIPTIFPYNSTKSPVRKKREKLTTKNPVVVKCDNPAVRTLVGNQFNKTLPVLKDYTRTFHFVKTVSETIPAFHGKCDSDLNASQTVDFNENCSVSTIANEEISPFSSLQGNGCIDKFHDNGRDSTVVRMQEEFCFDLLTNHLNRVKQPNQWWSLHCMPEYIICVKWDTAFLPERRLVVDNKLNVRIYLKHKEILTTLNVDVKIGCFEDLSNLLQEVDGFIICARVDNLTDNKDCLAYVGAVQGKSKFCLSCRKVEKKIQRQKTNADCKELRLKETIATLRKENESLRKNWISAEKRVKRQNQLILDMNHECIC